MENFSQFLADNMLLVGVFVVILVLLIQSFMDMRGINLVKPAAAVELLNREAAVILDVRLDDEFKGGHIRDSVHIPLGLLGNRLNELEQHQSRPIVVSCRSGSRSRQACSLLRKNGIQKLYVLDG